MPKILIIEKNTQKAEQLVNETKQYFKHKEIELIHDFDNIDLNSYANDLFISYNITIVQKLQNAFGAHNIKTLIIDSESETYCNIYATGRESAFTPDERDVDYPIERIIDTVFLTLGLRRNLSGTMYLKSAIKMVVETPYILMRSITTQLYPRIAEQFNTTPSKVERAIRHCLDTCYYDKRFMALNNLFEAEVFKNNDKPSNGEFIALIADKILLKLDNKSKNKNLRFG